jgi:hypothetical protein
MSHLHSLGHDSAVRRGNPFVSVRLLVLYFEHREKSRGWNSHSVPSCATTAAVLCDYEVPPTRRAIVQSIVRLWDPLAQTALIMNLLTMSMFGDTDLEMITSILRQTLCFPSCQGYYSEIFLSEQLQTQRPRTAPCGIFAFKCRKFVSYDTYPYFWTICTMDLHRGRKATLAI